MEGERWTTQRRSRRTGGSPPAGLAATTRPSPPLRLTWPARGGLLPVLVLSATLSAAAFAALAIRPTMPSLRAQVVAPAEPALLELNDLEQLRARFDQDLGKVRLLLLLSPT